MPFCARCRGMPNRFIASPDGKARQQEERFHSPNHTFIFCELPLGESL